MEKLTITSIKYLKLPLTSLSLNLVCELETKDGGKYITTTRLAYRLQDKKSFREQIIEQLNNEYSHCATVLKTATITESLGLS